MKSSNRWLILWLTVCLGLFGIAGACGDDDDDDDNDDSGESDDDTGDDDTDCGSADLIPGSWTGPLITLEIADDLSFHAVGVSQTAYDVTGQIELDGCTALVIDLTGDLACDSNQVGRYSYVVTATTLTTTLIEDNCAGRSLGLNGTVFTRDE
ncbi:MAG: hypothetical protein GX444_00610 [Myxococcales bacterium]|nr:hypothetical protein [Myxococcales bacterium]